MWSSLCLTGVTLLALCKVVVSLQCGPDQHNLNGLKCCTKCAAGSGVKTPCNQDNDTICAPCRKGELFSPEDSHEDQCQPCQTCPQYSHVKKMCNQSHDTQCECDHNYYFDSVSNSCRMCENCVMGFGAKRKCDLNRNTVCAQCPEGTFSDVISFDACKVCTSCKTTQLTLRYCDSTHNTICVDMPPNPIESTQAVSSTEAIVVEETKTTQDKLIPVYCAVLGLVILLLIIYVIVKQVQYRRNPPNNKKNISYLAVTEPGAATAGKIDGNTSATMQVAMANRNQGSDSGVSLEHDSRPISNGTRVKDIPSIKLRALEQMLHSSPHWRGGWTSFAREIGYNNSKISQFENKASQCGRMPAEILLVEWSKSENATAETLVRILKNCEREDIVTMLYSDSRNPAFNPQQQGISKGQMVTSGGGGNTGLPICNPNGPGRSMASSSGVVSYGNLGPSPPPQYSHIVGQEQMHVGQGHQGGGVVGQGQIDMAKGHMGNVGPGQPPLQHYHHHPAGAHVIGSMGQGQMNLGQGHSSVSGSSTTDLSGTGGSRYMGGNPQQQGDFQHVLPSYHSVQAGQQMV